MISSWAFLFVVEKGCTHHTTHTHTQNKTDWPVLLNTPYLTPFDLRDWDP